MNRNAPIGSKKHVVKADDKAQVKAMASLLPGIGCRFGRRSVDGAGLNEAELQALARKGLWGLLLFLLSGALLFLVRDFNLYRVLPAAVLQVLGSPPPATLIHLALAGYSFTVVVPVLIRMANGEQPVIGWCHLFWRLAFYLFYLVSTTLPENFLVLVVIGIFLFLVEQAGIWCYRFQHLDRSALT
jgi:hypothetical protein